MCEAHAAAGHETAAESFASEPTAPTAHSMSAEAATTTEAAARMTTAEAASAVATPTTTAPAARFGNAGRGSDDDCRSECSFDCE
jgi:hypothetical protein